MGTDKELGWEKFRDNSSDWSGKPGNGADLQPRLKSHFCARNHKFEWRAFKVGQAEKPMGTRRVDGRMVRLKSTVDRWAQKRVELERRKWWPVLHVMGRFYVQFRVSIGKLGLNGWKLVPKNNRNSHMRHGAELDGGRTRRVSNGVDRFETSHAHDRPWIGLDQNTVAAGRRSTELSGGWEPQGQRHAHHDWRSEARQILGAGWSGTFIRRRNRTTLHWPVE